MSKEILINSTPQETRIALIESKKVVEFFFERNADKGIVGNIYKGKVVRVLPGMQAAFVDIGHERAAFLYAGDFVKSRHNVEDMDVDGEEGSSFDANEGRRRRRSSEEVPPIAELVREGQEILVQVAKGPIGTKGARLTCHVSLPGRNLVFMPSLKHNGVSRKIESFEQRKKLKKAIDQHKTREGGFIVRTAASGQASERQIKSDVDYLLNLWKKIGRKYQTSPAPTLLHYDLDLTTRVIRDFLDDDIELMLIDSASEHRKVLKFIRNFNPELREKVELYQESTPLFDRYQVEPEIQKALSKRVWLKSGGYLIIEQTEALSSIDVNTGRFVGKKTLEETILKTNLEAAEEIVKQLRLRNIGGIIIIDFIDMERESSKEQVYRFLEGLLREDKAKTTILKISNLGLVEMTRKRTRESVHRYLAEQCPTCEGKSWVKSRVALAHQALRDVRRELPTLSTDQVFVTVHPEVYNILKNDEEDAIIALEKQYQKGIRIVSDSSFHFEQIAVSTTETGKPKGAALPTAQPSVLAKKDLPRVSVADDDDEYTDADYEADVKGAKADREAKARAIEEARRKQAEAQAARQQKREEEKAAAAAAAAAALSASEGSAEEIPSPSEPDTEIENSQIAHVAEIDEPDLEAPVIRARTETLVEPEDWEEAEGGLEETEKISPSDQAPEATAAAPEAEQERERRGQS